MAKTLSSTGWLVKTGRNIKKGIKKTGEALLYQLKGGKYGEIRNKKAEESIKRQEEIKKERGLK